MGNAAPATDFEIYDTEKDPQEAANLAASRPDLQEKMKAQALRSRRSSPLPPPVLTPVISRPFPLRWPAGGKAALARVEPFF